MAPVSEWRCDTWGIREAPNPEALDTPNSQPQPLTPARIAAIGGIVAAAVLVGVLMLSGSDKYSVKATFETAGQLVKGNEVQVGGKPIGKVTSIDLTDDGQAEIEIEIDSDFEPLHE